MERRIEIFDSTLRDGAQAEGIHFSVDDKLNIVRKLDKLGIPYIEAGNPGSNPKDFEFFERVRMLELRSAQLVAFGSTRRKDIAVEDDKNCRALIAADTEVIALFGKSWALHVENVLQTTRAENLRMIYDTIDYFVSHGKTVFFDAEHFFDGFRADPGYALETLRAAAQAGAQRLVLCDTNGGSFPADIADGVRAVRRELDIPVAIHCHNDLGCAVANSIEAVRCGAVQVQGTYIGFGERCGNASLSTLIPALQLKMGCRCITDEAMGRVTHTARYIAEVANYILPASTPVVGKSAFAHKAGMHVDAVQKLHASFENFPPERVGNNRSLLISEVAGRTAVANRLAQLDPTVTRDSPVTQEVMDALKELEHRGYQFESAQASLEIFLLKKLELFQPFFELENFRIIGEQSESHRQISSAMIKVRVGDRSEITAAEGDGPVHALDRALRKALEVFYPALAQTRLIDFKVRVVEQRAATASIVRVLIETTDGASVWTTVGASADIIEASWHALADSVEYKLLCDDRNGVLEVCGGIAAGGAQRQK
ncbi:citramalate synthase [Ligaoa zhengdingensis]|uniref:citramalate synthase n=1 Tax=Ligaoa zhengdingensis TaxID=2763658 RepID=UPI0031BA00F5